jgi:uncharacterized membrane protein YhiD involved in acid resistance
MDLTSPAPLSLPSLLINLLIGIILSLAVSFYYTRFGRSLSNRSKFAPLLPMLTLITLLVISIVKSSLALSLGLVGALSIVRFRTAIKDPEELIFLFFAIAIGLGLGADQRIPTLVAFIIILGYLLVRNYFEKNESSPQSMYLNIQINQDVSDTDIYSNINQLLVGQLQEVDLRRLDHHESQLQLTYYVSVKDSSSLSNLMDTLRKAYPRASVSLIEQNNLLGG